MKAQKYAEALTAATLVLGFALSVAGIGSASATGIPVIDVAKIANDTQNQVVNLGKYVQMIQQYKAQIDQMKQQYDSLTGSRGLGEIAQNPQLREYLPSNWQSVYDGVAKGGYKGLTGAGKAIADANHLFDPCAKLTGADKTVCERSGAKAAQDKAFSLGAFDKAKQRWDQIAQLMGQINSTTDPKSIAELQARINTEQAAIQNEQTKMQMYAMVSAAEDRLIEQQKRELTAKDAARRGYVTPLPVNFGN
jgi:type IV secretion system protein VirB5